MNCPNCGKEINDNQKFCTHCGYKINSSSVGISKNTDKKSSKMLIILSVIMLSVICATLVATFSNEYMTNTLNSLFVVKKSKTPPEILSEVDEYQKRYFEIVKRNDMFLQLWEYDESAKDQKDLKKLYQEVENKINKNNSYYKRYCEIEEKYAENPGQTTVDINDFEDKHFNAVVNLINEIYQTIKKDVISDADFQNLKQSERTWLKEVNAYKKVFDEQGYGTIGASVYYSYQIDMQKFRMLLLMLYL